MLHIAPSALPANASGAVAANPAALSLGAYGAASAAPIAPVQLPAAIMASGAVAAYHPNTQQPIKPAIRLASSSQPSSQLTAQYLAQTPDANHSDTSVFAPVMRTNGSAPPNETLSYLNDLRMANGELPTALPEAGKSAETSGGSGAPNATNISTANISTATEPAASRAVSSAQPSGAGGQMAAVNNAAPVMVQALALKTEPPIQARPAPAPLVPVGKKPNIGQARHAQAYQLAESRNAAMRFPPSVVAIF